MLEGRRRHAGNCIEKRLEVAIGAERQVGNLFCFDLCADVGTVCLEQGGRRRYQDLLRNAAGGHRDVNAGGRVAEQVDILMRVFLESCRLCSNAIFAGRHIGEGVVTAVVGYRLMN